MHRDHGVVARLDVIENADGVSVLDFNPGAGDDGFVGLGEALRTVVEAACK